MLNLNTTENQTKASNAQFTGSSDTIENNVLRKIRERREAEKKAEKEVMEAYGNVKSTKTLVDKAADDQKLRTAEDRRIGRLLCLFFLSMAMSLTFHLISY